MTGGLTKISKGTGIVWTHRVENSPEYEAEMERWRAEREANEIVGARQISDAREACLKSETGWLPMELCPFEALDNEYGFDGAIVVSNEKETALVTIRGRFGQPVFWKTEPERVMRDGILCLVGGERDPRDDLPAWWWAWELTDEFGLMTYAGGEETGKEEIGFVPTIWTFLPEPPKSRQ